MSTHAEATAAPTSVAPTSVEPEPTPTADPITCDTAFTSDMNTKMATDGLTFRDAGTNTDVDALVGVDGLHCQWAKPRTDIVVKYANWMQDEAAWETVKTQLLADGYTESGPFAVDRPVPEFDSAYRYRDGIIHYVSPSRFIDSVAALQ